MTDEIPYISQVTKAHVGLSLETLTELSTLVSTKKTEGSGDPQQLNLHLGLLDHGGFLNSLLYGMSMMDVDPDGKISGVSDDTAIRYAIILNHTLDDQIKTALSMIATLLARQEAVRALRKEDGSGLRLDLQVAESDQRETMVLTNSMKARGWRDTAVDFRRRAETSGFQLNVKVQAPLFSESEIQNRVRPMRTVYNEIPQVREAIDKTAGMLSRGFRIQGEQVPREALELTQKWFEVTEIKRYIAHVMRDAFVCGNGFLEIGTPNSPPRLLRPEHTTVNIDGSLIAFDPASGSERHIPSHGVLHVKGMHDVAGEIGVSTLEPFLNPLAMIGLAADGLRDAEKMAESSDPRALDWSSEMKEFADRVSRDGWQRVEEILGLATRDLPTPPSDLYFPGQESMDPAATQLRFDARRFQ